MSVLATIALAAAANTLPCLLVGPSQSSIVVGIVPGSEGEVVIAQYADREWPLGEQFKLSTTSSQDYRQSEPRSDGLVAEFSLIGQTYNVEIYRDGRRHKGLPVFSGSCPSSLNPDLPKYISFINSTVNSAPLPHDVITEARLSDSTDCQMASSSGWVSRFSLLFGESKSHFSIIPHDDHIWLQPISVEKLPVLPLPPPTSVFGMLSFDGAGSPKSFNGAIWVSGSKDGQSRSARVEFYHYTASGSHSAEWLSGICSKFVDSGATAS